MHKERHGDLRGCNTKFHTGTRTGGVKGNVSARGRALRRVVWRRIRKNSREQCFLVDGNQREYSLSIFSHDHMDAVGLHFMRFYIHHLHLFNPQISRATLFIPLGYSMDYYGWQCYARTH